MQVEIHLFKGIGGGRPRRSDGELRPFEKEREGKVGCNFYLSSLSLSLFVLLFVGGCGGEKSNTRVSFYIY